MAIDHPDTVDAIGVDDETDRIVLTITDHLPWTGSAEGHRSLPREKISTYLAFVESGEIYEVYPNAAGREILISVVGKFDLFSDRYRVFR